MSFVQYSPWLDAAAYGQALGNTLAQVMFRLPHERERQNIEREKLDLERQKISTEQDLARTHGLYYKAMAANLPEKEALAQQLAKSLMGYREKIAGVRSAEEESKDAFRKGVLGVREGQLDLNRSIMPHRLGLMDAQTQHLGALEEQQPINQAIKLIVAQIMGGGSAPDWINSINEDLGYRMRNAIKIPPPAGIPLTPGGANNSLMPQTQQPQPSSVPTITPQAQQPSLMPQNAPTTDPTRPPTSLHTVRIRVKSTGQTGWAMPQELATNPDLEQIPF